LPDSARPTQPSPHKPNISHRVARPQFHDCGVVILIYLEIAADDVNGNELAIVLGPELWRYPLIKDVGPEPCEFFRTTLWVGDRQF
jgi:hypothetical protein